jgi:hypothetical protein
MLDWLKTILGDTYTEEIDKKVSAEIGKEFVSRADFNTANEAKKTLDTTLKERDKQLEELKKVDPAALQAKITELQTANTTAQTEFDTKLKQIKLESALETRLIKEGAVNTKAVKALLDTGKISMDGDNIIGLDEQLKTLKESEKWAFGEQQQISTGLQHGGSIETNMSDVEKAFMAKNPDVKLD